MDRTDNEIRYRTLFERAPVGIVYADAQSHYIDANECICRMLGYTREELIGMHASQIVDAAETRHISGALEEITAGSGHQREWRFRRKDGSYFIGHVIATQFPDGTLLGMIQDVTAQRSERLFSDAMIDSMPGVVYFYDATGRFLRWNRNFETVTGYSAQEIARMHPLDFFSPADRPLLQSRIGEVFETGESSVEAPILSRDGTQTAYFFTGRRLTFEDRTCLVGIGIDISDRKRLEEQIRQAQKMEAIGQLAGGVAHDFNNILGAILGNADLALADTSPEHPAREGLEEIRKAAIRATGIVQQILTFSRQQPQHPRVIDLTPTVQEACTLLRATIPTVAEIKLRTDAAVPPVLADPTQVYQVVTNLCTNAWHALEGRPGHIEIRLEPVVLDEATARRITNIQPGTFACLSVSDTGKGMDATTARRIFDPFFTTKEPGKGTGLGLSVVHGIMQAHHGAITVDSEPGRGSTFRAYFPGA